MATKEEIKSEIEKVPEERLAELYQIVRRFTQSREASSQSTLMSRLRRIRISAPPDFSENIDLYLTGEKTFE
jgi:propanediol dehydratase small subunit